MNKETQSLHELCENLNLDYESQDWGIINSNPQRLGEFIDYYEFQPLNKTQKYHMAELIFSSANEGLLEKQLTDKDIAKLNKFITNHGKEVCVQLSYWEKLPNTGEYPIVELIKL